MQRTPEPQLMDETAQAMAYANADFTEPHNHFVTLLQEHFPELQPGTVLDLGCGPGDICRRIARAYPGSRIIGVDGAKAMLEEGRRANQREGLSARIELEFALLPGDPLPSGPFEAIVSNSLLHHLDDPQTLWSTVRSLATGTMPVFIMDLHRPATPESAHALVERYAADEPEILRKDFENSLHAAYTQQEVETQLREAGLKGLRVENVSDRHLVAFGVA